MKKLFQIMIFAICINCVFAQNYLINFAGTGASSKVDSVQVENLTQCQSLSLYGSDILDINGTVSINEISSSSDNALHIYPNPVTDYCYIDFEATAQGETTISLYDITGKRISQTQEFLFKGHHTYYLNVPCSGIYVLKVESAQYGYAAKMVSCNAYSVSRIAEIRHETQVSSIKTQDIATIAGGMKSLKSNKSYKVMQYTPGDTLKLTGFSGIYRTVFMLVLTQSQTVTFTFVACTDGSGNNYAVVQIGTQTWMAENLKTTKYNNASAITNVTNNTTWENIYYTYTPAYCWYDNDATKSYGALYDWYAVNTGNLCPSGWHVASDGEWTTLTNTLGGLSVSGGKMKDTCSTYWDSPNTAATNSSGFTALPGGFRDTGGNFDNQGQTGLWWTATGNGIGVAWARTINNNNSGVNRGGGNYECYGFSVRCIKN